MTLSKDQRIECLKLAVQVTSRNKDEAIKVAREFMDFVESWEAGPMTTVTTSLQAEETRDKQTPPKRRRGRPPKTAGKTAASENADNLV